jgi:hypothetical protein
MPHTLPLSVPLSVPLPTRLPRAACAAALAAAHALGAGCTAGSPAAPADAAAGAAAGVTAALRVAPDAVAPGAPFVVRYTITNATRDTARLVFGCATPLGATTLRPAGGDAGEPLQSGGCYTALSAAVLPPGGEQVVAREWRATAGTAAPGAAPLAPGRYVVEVVPALLEVNGRPASLPALRAELAVR